MLIPPQPYHTIIPPSNFEDQNNLIHISNIKLNIFLGKSSCFTPNLYSFLNNLRSPYLISLCASLLQDQNLLSVLLPKIYTVLSLNTLFNGQTTLPIFTNVFNQTTHFNIQPLQTYLADQGLHVVKFPVFDCSVCGMQTIEDCSLTVIQKEPEKWRKLFNENEQTATTRIIASINESNEFIFLGQEIFAVNKLHSAEISIWHLYENRQEIEHEIELWKKRSALYQDFLSLSKEIQEKEYYDVLNWYTNEYEALPLWYKRFGHIIKAATGKRTWASLFNDNVKKHK